MITSIGSPNDALWSQMERAGWAQQIAGDDPTIAGVAGTYAFTELGAQAVTKAIAELASWNAEILALFKDFESPEHVRQLCRVFSRLTLRTAAQLAITKKETPATDEGRARQHDCILALDEISKGVRMAGQYIMEALAVGHDSEVGRDRLERSTAGLRYAEKCLTEWAAEIRTKQSDSSAPS